MSRFGSALLAGGALAASLLGLPPRLLAQPASPTVASAAFGIQAGFTGGNMSTSLGPVAAVSGAAPPAYAKTKVVGGYSGSIAIPPLEPGGTVYPMVASLSVQASMLKSHVVSAGVQIDNVSASGTAAIGSVDLRITNPQPVPPPIPVAAEFLAVVANGVKASASYTRVYPSAVDVTGAASFKSLVINGSLLGGRTISYSGAVPANTVLFSSPTLTITAHQQIIAAEVACPPCVVTPSGIVVHALDISFANAVIDGRSFSGEITLGDASASASQ